MIPVYAAGEEGGHLYLVMRYVNGHRPAGPARARAAGCRPRARRAIGPQIGAALDAAHAVGLVHRDVKPANVLLSGEHAYLADFGLSQVVGHRHAADHHRAVDRHASTSWRPSSSRGDEVDARADVYALGCVLYNALTGETPYPRGTVPATMLAHMQDDAAAADGGRAGRARRASTA